MTRTSQIHSLRRRYAQAMSLRQRKLAGEIYAKLKPLMTMQVRVEDRQDRRMEKAA
jgi:hypothetical protein